MTSFFLGFITGAATALLLEFLIECWRDWRWRRETRLLLEADREFVEPNNNETTT